MAFDDNLKRSGNTYILKSKTKTHKKGECEECGHNPNDEYSTGLYRYKASHMQMVRNHIEDHLKLHSIYGKRPKVVTAKKQERWVGIQREKYGMV